MFWFEVFEGVFRDIGETAGAEEITAEIIARSEGYPDEQDLVFEDDDELTEILRQRDRDGAFGHGGEGDQECSSSPGSVMSGPAKAGEALVRPA